MKNKQNIIPIALISVVLLGCAKQEPQSSLGPEITCSLAQPFAESAIEMRQENVPKFVAKATESVVYLFQDKDMAELHEKLQDVIELAYEQDKVKTAAEKQKQLQDFSKLAYEQCIKNF